MSNIVGEYLNLDFANENIKSQKELSKEYVGERAKINLFFEKLEEQRAILLLSREEKKQPAGDELKERDVSARSTNPSGAANLNPAEKPTSNQEEQDHLLALTLQEEGFRHCK